MVAKAAYCNLRCDGVWLVRMKIVTIAALERHREMAHVMLPDSVAWFSLSMVDCGSPIRSRAGRPNPVCMAT